MQKKKRDTTADQLGDPRFMTPNVRCARYAAMVTEVPCTISSLTTGTRHPPSQVLDKMPRYGS
jgi:hypothetical protein